MPAKIIQARTRNSSYPFLHGRCKECGRVFWFLDRIVSKPSGKGVAYYCPPCAKKLLII